MPDAYHGLLVLDKPTGITSRDAVNRALGWFPRGTRIGHTGTLDPLATGVLVLCIGSATRLTEYVQHMNKVYRATVVFGATSDSDDADGTITATMNAPVPTHEQVAQALATFVGEIEQVPPAYSAAKVSGRRAYALARKGQEVRLEPRRVVVHDIELSNYTYPQLEIVVRCGKGTYIRSLARDLGSRLGCGGYITSLRRLGVGTFTEADAITLEANVESARARLLPTWHAVAHLPRHTVSSSDIVRLLKGQALPAANPSAALDTEVALFDEVGTLVAVANAVGDWLRPNKVFAERGKE